jgi:pimeloyl-ACP methyl ester carboxylesterase
MQLFPTGFDRVVLDSFVAPGSSLARQDQDADEAARDLLKACGEDAGCAAKLGADPVAFTDALFAKLKAGHCGELVVPPGAEGRPLYAAVRLAIGSFLMQLQVRPAIFPLLHRLDRCNAADVATLQTFLDIVYADGGDLGADPLLNQWGFVLSNNIAYSELWEQPSPTKEELAAIRESSIATRDITVNMAQEHAIWPIYPPDELVGKWPDESKTPVLVLSGGFDPATLLRKSLVAKEHFTGEGRHFVVVPSATHFVIGTSPTTQKRSCGTKMMMSFLDDPKAPDMSCLAEVLPTSFEPDPGLSQALFGTTNPWD